MRAPHLVQRSGIEVQSALPWVRCVDRGHGDCYPEGGRGMKTSPMAINVICPRCDIPHWLNVESAEVNLVQGNLKDGHISVRDYPMCSSCNEWLVLIVNEKGKPS